MVEKKFKKVGVGNYIIKGSNGLEMHIVSGKLHRDDGPAVICGKTKRYYWKGILVPEQLVMNPRSRSVVDILKERNAELRRCWLEAWGPDALNSLVEAGKAEVIHRTKTPPRELIKITAFKDVDEEYPLYVKVTCPSTGREYMLRVRPNIRTCEAAVAYTFRGVTVADIKNMVET